jgi:exopolysaccharide biosynthesis polyprenyl glycosylphosphotransferase
LTATGGVDTRVKTARTAQQPVETRRASSAGPSLGEARDIRARTPRLLLGLAGRDGLRWLARVTTLLTIDLLGLAAALFSALALKALVLGELSADETLETTAEYLPFAFLVTTLLFARAGLYSSRESRPGTARTIATLFQVTVVSLVFALVSGVEFSTYWLFWGGLFFASVFICALRFAYERLTGRLLGSLGYRRRAVLVGTSRRIGAVADALAGGPSPYETVGFLSLDESPENGLRDLGEVEELPRRIDQHAIEEVIIADPDFPQDRAVRVIEICQARGVRVRVAPSTMEVLIQRAELVPGDGIPLFDLKPPVFEGFDFVVKRSFDIVLAGVGLILLSPLLALVAISVKVSSRGPILHRSLRPGLGGRPFRCLKFRTMYEDAEERQVDFEHLNEARGAIFKIREDPRLTPVGRLLRRNSIDELPQLFNVIRGEMSLVGPRPLPLRDHARLEDWHRRRYLVLPGITGLWQVSGRSDLDFDDMVRLDFLYLERWSVLLDLVILLKTVPAVIRRRGAY